MALSKSVEESLKEAELALRNALAFAARGERPVVCGTIAAVSYTHLTLPTNREV